MDNTVKCYWAGTIGGLCAMDRGEFVARMKSGERKILGKKPETSQLKSWRDCFKVLKNDVFGRLGEPAWKCWQKLPIMFECVLPNSRRPDVLIFSKNMIVVLEFKKMSEPYDGFLKTVKSYQRTIRRWECLRQGRKVKGVIVYTEMDERHDVRRIQLCSAGKLGAALLHLLGKYPEAGA